MNLNLVFRYSLFDKIVLFIFFKFFFKKNILARVVFGLCLYNSDFFDRDVILFDSWSYACECLPAA